MGQQWVDWRWTGQGALDQVHLEKLLELHQPEGSLVHQQIHLNILPVPKGTQIKLSIMGASSY